MKKLLFVLLAGAATTGAQAVTIDFESLAHDDFFRFHNPLTIDGFFFSNPGAGNGGPEALASWGRTQSFNADPGGATLFQNFPGTTTSVSKVGGGTFALTSIDLADVYNNGNGGNIRFDFFSALGNSTVTVTIDNLPGLETFFFNKTDLTSFDITALTTEGPWLQMDNVVLDGAVIPEPASWAMMIAGFGLAGSAMRRRVKVAFA
jgi:hypothetical protein